MPHLRFSINPVKPVLDKKGNVRIYDKVVFFFTNVDVDCKPAVLRDKT
jgi:hypothetical protein